MEIKERIASMHRILTKYNINRLPTTNVISDYEKLIMNNMTEIELKYVWMNTKMPLDTLLDPNFGSYIRLQETKHLYYMTIRGLDLWRDVNPLIACIERACPEPHSFKNNTYSMTEMCDIVDNRTCTFSNDKAKWLKALYRTTDFWDKTPQDVLIRIIRTPNSLSFGAHLEIVGCITNKNDYPFLGDVSTIKSHNPNANHVENYVRVFDGVPPMITRVHIQRLLLSSMFTQNTILTKVWLDHAWYKDLTDEIISHMDNHILFKDLAETVVKMPYEITSELDKNTKVNLSELYGTAILNPDEHTDLFATFIGDHLPEVAAKYLQENL